MPAYACVVTMMVCWADSLVRIASEKKSLTLVTPSPAPLLSRGGTKTVTSARVSLSKINQIFSALARVVRFTVRRADSLAWITQEKKSLALKAPSPLCLKFSHHLLLAESWCAFQTASAFRWE